MFSEDQTRNSIFSYALWILKSMYDGNEIPKDSEKSMVSHWKDDSNVFGFYTVVS